MGQKVSPHGLRVGVIKDWSSKWYADKEQFSDTLVEDNQIRKHIEKKLYAAGVARVLIERAAENKVRVTTLVARPGMVVGKSGTGADELTAACNEPDRDRARAYHKQHGDLCAVYHL